MFGLKSKGSHGTTTLFGTSKIRRKIRIMSKSYLYFSVLPLNTWTGEKTEAHSIRVPGRPLPHNPAISTLLYRTMAGANRSSLFLPMCLKEIRHEESFRSYKVKGHLHRCGQDNILTRIQGCRHQKTVCQSGIRKLITSFSTLTLHVPTGVPFNRRPSTLTGVWLSACNVSSAVR